MLNKLKRYMTKDRSSYLIALGISVLGAFMVGAIIILATGNDPLKAYGALIKGAFGSTRAL